jgi:hypothetical protein
MDKNKKLFYTIIGAISALAAATAAFLALKKHRCAEQKLQPMSLLRKNKQQVVAPNSGSSICICKS